MNVQLTPDQQALIHDAIASGRVRTEEEAIRQAMALWEERERTRTELIGAIEEAEASLEQGEGRVFTAENSHQIAADVSRRGRSHFAAEQRRP